MSPRRRGFRPRRWAWLLLLAALLAPAYELFLPAGAFPPRERRTLVIVRGQSLHVIAHELQRVGVLHGATTFLVLARLMQLDRSIKAGQYAFRLGITVPAILRALERGMYGLNLVTVPEGLTLTEVGRLLDQKIALPAPVLDSLAHDRAFLDSLGVGAPSLEGWLAPDSYELLPGTAPEVVVRSMVERTRDRVARVTAGCDSLPLGMGTNQLLTLASIVESEAERPAERPRIARVYLNRLQRGMRLQADPTVGYALGRGPRSRLWFKDLHVESRYNTYLHPGLPPGPICSPGQASLEAVVNATPGDKDLYFVARGDGGHMFAPTYAQHLANIAAAKALQRAMERGRGLAPAAAESVGAARAIAAEAGPAPRPGAEARTAGEGRPGAETKPAGAAKPAAEASKPGSEAKAAGAAKPGADAAKPGAETKPAGAGKPGATAGATTHAKHAAAAKPAAAESAAAKPAGPAARAKPAAKHHARHAADSTRAGATKPPARPGH